MVQNCCVTGCKNVWKANSSIAYHTFPLKNEARLAQWMQIDELKDIKVTSGKRICSVHFTPESFEEFCAVKRLKKTAVPSLFGEAVQVMDDDTTEEIEIWEEIYINDVPEGTKNALNQISKVEGIEQEIEKETEPELEQELDKEEIPLSSVEYDLPAVIETKNASIQTISVYYEYREEIWNMRKKIAMLRQQIKQRESSIAKTRKLIHELTSIKVSKKDKVLRPLNKSTYNQLIVLVK